MNNNNWREGGNLSTAVTHPAVNCCSTLQRCFCTHTTHTPTHTHVHTHAQRLQTTYCGITHTHIYIYVYILIYIEPGQPYGSPNWVVLYRDVRGPHRAQRLGV